MSHDLSIGALAERLWATHPGRVVDVVADAHYAGADGAPVRDGCRGRGLPAPDLPWRVRGAPRSLVSKNFLGLSQLDID